MATKQEQITIVAKKLNTVTPMPEWARFVKTSNAKDRPPIQDDWWQMRAASILNQVSEKGPIGVSKLRTKYGARKNRGVRPEEFRLASGKIIRTILQQLEKGGLIKKEAVGVHKGRVLTAKGNELFKEK
ncbi:MAG: 40S ribosomal protein S19 [Candidatus Woesearchaeota archaeon]